MGFKDAITGKKSEPKRTKDQDFEQEEKLEKSNYEPAKREVEQEEKQSLPRKIIGGLMNSGNKKPGQPFVQVNARSPRHYEDQLNQNFRAAVPGSIHMDTDNHSSALNRAMSGESNRKRGVKYGHPFLNIGSLDMSGSAGYGHPALSGIGSLTIGKGRNYGKHPGLVVGSLRIGDRARPRRARRRK